MHNLNKLTKTLAVLSSLVLTLSSFGSVCSAEGVSEAEAGGILIEAASAEFQDPTESIEVPTESMLTTGAVTTTVTGVQETAQTPMTVVGGISTQPAETTEVAIEGLVTTAPVDDIDGISMATDELSESETSLVQEPVQSFQGTPPEVNTHGNSSYVAPECSFEIGCVCGGCESDYFKWDQFGSSQCGCAFRYGYPVNDAWAGYSMGAEGHIADYGCYIMSIATLLELTGEFIDYCPLQFVKYAVANMIDYNTGQLTDPSGVANIPNHQGVFQFGVNNGSKYCSRLSDGTGRAYGSHKDMYELALDLVMDGYYVVLHKNGHFVPVVDYVPANNVFGYGLVVSDGGTARDDECGSYVSYDGETAVSGNYNAFYGDLDSIRVFRCETSEFQSGGTEAPSGYNRKAIEALRDLFGDDFSLDMLDEFSMVGNPKYATEIARMDAKKLETQVKLDEEKKSKAKQYSDPSVTAVATGARVGAEIGRVTTKTHTTVTTEATPVLPETSTKDSAKTFEPVMPDVKWCSSEQTTFTTVIG